ncbi:MAG TPA: roadblock/LC7 domain-containing protein [Candidatus Thermoplasmatota archaeon]|nr:roadblock/LC7 domain-containing protein [Candidatus Thermoplasmatota archaeon]
MMDRQARLESLLEELAGEKGVLGAALVSRDGLAVRASGRLAQSRETFSAMVATAMGATEIAIAELDGGKTHHMIATTDRLKLIVVGATRDLLLVAATQADTPHDKLLPRLESAAQNVALALSGG